MAVQKTEASARRQLELTSTHVVLIALSLLFIAIVFWPSGHGTHTERESQLDEHFAEVQARRERRAKVAASQGAAGVNPVPPTSTQPSGAADGNVQPGTPAAGSPVGDGTGSANTTSGGDDSTAAGSGAVSGVTQSDAGSGDGGSQGAAGGGEPEATSSGARSVGDVETPPTPGSDAADSTPAVIGDGGVPYPLATKYGLLFVVPNPNSPEESMRQVGPVVEEDGRKVLQMPETVTKVLIDVGTNRNPETLPQYGGDETAALLWFEPVKELQEMAIEAGKKCCAGSEKRHFPFNAAVSPAPGHVLFNLARESGCNSLLEMNPAGLKHMRRRTPQFMKDCLILAKKVPVALVRGEELMPVIPSRMKLHYLGIDAQGFDLSVASSFGAALQRFDAIMLECQDLPQGHDLLIVQGAYTCTEVHHCMSKYVPEHKMVNKKGEPGMWCAYNNAGSREFNCVFMKPGAAVDTPNAVFGAEIKEPMREGLVCPPLKKPSQPSTLPPAEATGAPST